jgi:hypothetical protein
MELQPSQVQVRHAIAGGRVPASRDYFAGAGGAVAPLVAGVDALGLFDSDQT